MSSSHMIEQPEFYQKNCEISKDSFIVFSSEGVRGFTILMEAFDSTDAPAAFLEGEKYTISISPDAWNSPPKDENSYDEIMNQNRNWINILSFDLGSGSIIGNSFSDERMGMFPSPLHFKWIKISVPALPDIKVRFTVGTR